MSKVIQVNDHRFAYLRHRFNLGKLLIFGFTGVIPGARIYQSLRPAGRRLVLQKRKPVAAVPRQKTATVEWLETVIDKAQNSPAVCTSALIVRLPSGAAMELANASQASVAAALLRAWEKAPC